MSTKQFDQLLTSTLTEIDNKIKGNLVTVINKEADKVRKESNYSKLISKKEKLTEELRLLEIEINSKDWELDYSNSYHCTKDKWPEDINEQFKNKCPNSIRYLQFSPQRSWHVSEWQAFLNIQEGSIELKNYEQFQSLSKQYREIYSLAITPKEKRQILMQLRSLNWRELGIDMPTLMADFSIESGMIKSQLLLTK